ncbi:MAG: OmpA family protein [Acidobacteria bacterium]|nr:OmpA family protein [Acidobacteriota bacterium]
MSRIRSLLVLIVFALCVSGAHAQETDVKGSADHPVLTRMQNMYITVYKTSEFDQFAFKTGPKATTAVEGKRFEIRYVTKTGSVPPTPVAIIRNHQQAIARIGGTTVYEDQRYTTLKLAKDGKEIWVQVDTAWGKGYFLTIVEKQAMVQEVVASAELFKAGLNTTGHVEVPGIFFDTGKSVLKPESDAAVGEIAKLLQADPALKVYVVGHTDSVAALDLNMKLSQARAEAVVQTLVTKHGIAAARLVGRGVGPLCPVASNDTEEGRAKNRRVELVKQ